MRLTKKIIIWTASIILLFITVAVLAFLLSSFGCTNTVYNKIENTNYEVVHKLVDCGTTTNHATAILVHRKWRPMLATNVLKLDGKYTEEDIRMKWESLDTLRIDFNGRATDLRRVAFRAKGANTTIYENGNELTIERLEEIEKEIIKEQASYKVVLPEGHRWIEVSE